MDITERKRAEEKLRNTQDFSECGTAKIFRLVSLLKMLWNKDLFIGMLLAKNCLAIPATKCWENNAADLLEADQANYLQAQDLEVFATGKEVDIPEENHPTSAPGKADFAHEKSSFV